MHFPLEKLLDELKSAQTYESMRITGHNEILSFPSPTLLTDAGRSEVTEALNWSTARLVLLTAAASGLEALIQDKYPERVVQLCDADIIKELKLSLNLLGLAVEEFKAPPTPKLSIWAEENA